MLNCNQVPVNIPAWLNGTPVNVGSITDKVTHVAIVLDKSGSMGSVRRETVNGFNEQVDVLRRQANDGGQTFASLFTFNDQVYETFFNQDASQLERLSMFDYSPEGGTALRDAVGYAIERLRRTHENDGRNHAFLVIIISDGEENSSRHFSESQLAEKIQTLQRQGNWTFTYLGANCDLSRIRQTYGFTKGNTMQYCSTREGTQLALHSNARGLSSYLDSRSKGLEAVSDFYELPDNNDNTQNQNNTPEILVTMPTPVNDN